ncbi:MAG: 50S ribosomal protein L25 [bacterium]|nr:50S ribosomal protein L25 [bacterium]
MFLINAKTRDLGISTKELKSKALMPAVFYAGGKPATAISVPLNEFKKVWYKAGASSAVKIKLEGKDIDVLIHDVQNHPITDEPIHADFLVIDMNKKIEVNIPLEFTGVSLAVKSGLGILVKVLHEITIEALPKDLPHEIIVDISKLQTLEDSIFVSDIKVGAGVTIKNDLTEVVASIVEQKEEKEESIPVDLSAIEVDKKGKKDLSAESEEEAPVAL